MVGKMYTRKMPKNYLRVALMIGLYGNVYTSNILTCYSTRYINVAKDIILIITDTVDSQICFSLKQGRGKNQFGWLYFSVNENEYIA